ncbi:phytochrome-associated protein 2 [Perilla frutescens var. hirtella]|uniref:Auxin-responsive protein n=1 Tax=Perilla frutescens var. hirtella TaxID=608512 RepID=A0AAD4P9Y1_PERFH|nr:phytochrome-associated protein 2 [Perilla frutescens var. hirtella]KAH6832449.1 phytochrome-associated protein 2 [Perilla frutescens var. hirtella]
MSIPQEHDYIGLSEALPLEKSSDKNKVFNNLKETELRLGLPGSELPERKGGIGVSLFGKDLKDENKKSFVSGAKRGFSDAINGAGKWGLSINGGSEVATAVSNTTNSSKSSLNVKEIPAVKPVGERKNDTANTASASKAQVVGWPPIRSFRKNTLATNLPKNDDAGGKSGSGCLYVKVSMDGAPYLRKIDLKTYCNYAELSSALEKMFSCFTIGQYGQGLAGKEHLSESHLMDLLHGSEYVLTYEDKDSDWMLVGDVPWEMFTDSCRRLRIMKGSDAIGLAPRTMQKCKSQN